MQHVLAGQTAHVPGDPGAPPLPPWRDPALYAPAPIDPRWVPPAPDPAANDCAFIRGGFAHPCTLAFLRAEIAKDTNRDIALVQLPGDARPRSPYEVPEIFPEVRQREIRYARSRAALWLFLLLPSALQALQGWRDGAPPRDNLGLALVSVSAFFTLSALWDTRQARRSVPAEVPVRGEEARYEAWRGHRDLRGTLALLLGLFGVQFVEFGSGVRALVWSGWLVHSSRRRRGPRSPGKRADSAAGHRPGG